MLNSILSHTGNKMKLDVMRRKQRKGVDQKILWAFRVRKTSQYGLIEHNVFSQATELLPRSLKKAMYVWHCFSCCTFMWHDMEKQFINSSGVARISKLLGHSNLCRPCPFSVACNRSRPWRRVTNTYHPGLYIFYWECSRFVEFGWRGCH